jgi:hypothetical protein
MAWINEKIDKINERLDALENTTVRFMTGEEIIQRIHRLEGKLQQPGAWMTLEQAEARVADRELADFVRRYKEAERERGIEAIKQIFLISPHYDFYEFLYDKGIRAEDLR